MAPNPYESPQSPPELPNRSGPIRAWHQFTVTEWLVIIGIISILIASMLPAVESGPHHRRLRSAPMEQVEQP